MEEERRTVALNVRLPADLHADLVDRAREHRQSLNREILASLQAVSEQMVGIRGAAQAIQDTFGGTRGAMAEAMARLGEVAREGTEAKGRMATLISEQQFARMTEAADVLSRIAQSLNDERGRQLREIVKTFSPWTGIKGLHVAGLMGSDAMATATAATVRPPLEAAASAVVADHVFDVPHPYDAAEHIAQLRQEVAELREELQLLHQKVEGAG